jgi:hypothetical protein
MQFSPVLAARIFLRPSYAYQAKLKNHRYSDLRQMTSGSGRPDASRSGAVQSLASPRNNEKEKQEAERRQTLF